MRLETVLLDNIFLCVLFVVLLELSSVLGITLAAQLKFDVGFELRCESLKKIQNIFLIPQQIALILLPGRLSAIYWAVFRCIFLNLPAKSLVTECELLPFSIFLKLDLGSGLCLADFVVNL